MNKSTNTMAKVLFLLLLAVAGSVENEARVFEGADTPYKDVNGTLALVGERYTTEEAILAAAKSYGGFT